MRADRPIFPCQVKTWLLLVVLWASATASLPAQYMTETFDTIANLWARGWAQQNRSTSPGAQPNWFQGDPGVFAAHDGGDTAYIAANYNSLGGSGTISNWLFTPTRTFTNGEKLSFWTRTVDHPNYPDRMQFRLSLNGASTDVGTTASSVGDFTTLLVAINPVLTTSGYPNHWQEYRVIVSGLTAPTSGRAAFRYFVGNGGPSGNNSEYIGVDSFAYFLPPAGDLMIQSIQPMEYTQIPERHPFPGPFVASFVNDGSTPVTNGSLQVNVYNGVGTLIYTVSSAPHATMAPGDIVSDTVAAPTGLTPDSYTIEYIARHPAFDGNHANDTLRDHFSIVPHTYARDNGDVIGDIGIGAYVGGYVGQEYHFYQPDNIDSIWVHVTKGYTGRRIAAVVWDMVAGRPNQIVGSTDTLVYVTDSAADYVLPIHHAPLTLPAGDFVVTMVEFDSTLHVGMASGVFTVGTTWLSWPTLPSDWANVEFFGLPEYKHAQMIRPILGDFVVGMDEGIAGLDCSVFPNPNTGSFEVGFHSAVPTDLGITVVDVLGRPIYAVLAKGVASWRHPVDLGAVPSGVYFVVFKTKSGSRVMRAFVGN